MAENRGRPAKPEAEKKSAKYLMKMKPDFYRRLKDFSELTGMSINEIFTAGAAKFINDWHNKKQESYRP